MGIKIGNFIIKLLLGALGLIVLDAFWFEKYIVQWNQFKLTNRDCDYNKLVQLGDLHLYSIKSHHNTLVHRIYLKNPYAVLFTGDSITSTKYTPLLNSFLDLIDPSILKLAILGNKEYSDNVDPDLLKKPIKTTMAFC